MNQFPTSFGFPLDVPCFLSSVLGRASCPSRGIGGEATKRSYRGVAPAPMLAHTEKHRSQNITKTNPNGPHKGKIMNKSTTKTPHTLPPNLRLLPHFLIITFCILSSGCSSQRHKTNSLVNLLSAEETLLHSIEAERSTKTLKQRLERDQTLLEAEWHLREAIRALFEANHAVRRSL